MRAPSAATVLILLVLLVPPPALAQVDGPGATLVLEVQPDRSEIMTLTFDGLRRLTRYNDICLPQGARETSVRDGVGAVDYDVREEDGRRSVSFTARDETLTISMLRPASEAPDRPLHAGDANFCVPGGSHVTTTIRVPEGHVLFFVSEHATIVGGREATLEKDGPMHVFYSYEAPLAGSGLEAFDVPPFRVLADPAFADQAQQAARLAAGPLAAALAEAGLTPPFDAIRVLYQPQTPHAWEAGHYNGHGYVAVKEDTLSEEPEEGWPIKAVKVLVHEAFHAASFPYGRGPVEDSISWWLEGTAKHSERHVDAAMPNATTHCEKSAVEVRCWSFDDRIARQDLETAYSSSFTFQTGWEPSAPQSDDTRTFYYAYSEFVVGAWIARHGVEEYRLVWDAIEAAFRDGTGCPCDDGWLLGVLDDDELFTPWAGLRASEPERFEANVAPLVKDEAALQRQLEAQANPLPSPAWAALAALGLAALAFTRRRSG